MNTTSTRTTSTRTPSTPAGVRTHRSASRPLGALMAVLGSIGMLLGLTADPAAAIVVDTDRPRISAQELDFGRNWALGAPINGGFLDWDLTNGIVTPQLTGNLYINNASGTCARMQLRYYDVSHVRLATRSGGTVCAPDGSLNRWSVNLSPYGSAFVTHVHVVLQVQNNNGTYSDVGSQGWFLN